jgi:hypothetical protein
MEKAKINYIVDFFAGISFFITTITGLIILLFLPSGVRQGSYQTFLGIQKIFFSEVHNWAGIIFIILVLIHLVLHWNWIICMTKNLFNKKDQ